MTQENKEHITGFLKIQTQCENMKDLEIYASPDLKQWFKMPNKCKEDFVLPLIAEYTGNLYFKYCFGGDNID